MTPATIVPALLESSAMTDLSDPERETVAAAEGVPGLDAEALAVIEAARCIRHWHGSGIGMVVSADHVRALWAALERYDAALSAQTGGADAAAGGVPGLDAEALAEALYETDPNASGRRMTWLEIAANEKAGGIIAPTILTSYRAHAAAIIARLAPADGVDAPVVGDRWAAAMENVSAEIAATRAMMAAAPPPSRPTVPVDRGREKGRFVEIAPNHSLFVGSDEARAALDKADDGAAAGVDDALDAARYRWLRSRDVDTVYEGGVFAGKTPENLVLSEEHLDAAVDGGMAADRAAGPQAGEAS